MTVFQYDSTFEGLLTALFDAYYRRTFPDLLLAEKEPLPLFYEEVHLVVTDAERQNGFGNCYHVNFPEGHLPPLPIAGSRRHRKLPCSFSLHAESNRCTGLYRTKFRRPGCVRSVSTQQKVADERMRVLQFMRFQKTADQVYFGIMEPLYNVYPLTIHHFRDRFADQPWIIYDARRHYGYYYDLKEVSEITFEDSRAAFLRHGKLEDELLDKNEKLSRRAGKAIFTVYVFNPD